MYLNMQRHATNYGALYNLIVRLGTRNFIDSLDFSQGKYLYLYQLTSLIPHQEQNGILSLSSNMQTRIKTSLARLTCKCCLSIYK